MQRERAEAREALTAQLFAPESVGLRTDWQQGGALAAAAAARRVGASQEEMFGDSDEDCGEVEV